MRRTGSRPHQRSSRCVAKRGARVSFAALALWLGAAFAGCSAPVPTGNPDATGGVASGSHSSGGGPSGGATSSGGVDGGITTGGTSGAGDGGEASGGVGVGASSSDGGSESSSATGGSPLASGGSGSSAGSGGSSTGSGGSSALPDPNFHVFLLFGQSNMLGIPEPEPRDEIAHERVEVLAYDDCPNLGRKEGEWYPASAPLHDCYTGVGPGDTFGKKVADSLPGARIGLVPCGLYTADIDAFRKGVVSSRRSEFPIPPDDHWAGAYEWMMSRARKAQESGVIRGILIHHGESDTGDSTWVGKVKEVVDDLRTDLSLGRVPVLVGELAYNACCSSHNQKIGQLPSLVDNAYVISAAGLSGLPDQTYHFDLQSQRTFGERYADKLLAIWKP